MSKIKRTEYFTDQCMNNQRIILDECLSVENGLSIDNDNCNKRLKFVCIKSKNFKTLLMNYKKTAFYFDFKPEPNKFNDPINAYKEVVFGASLYEKMIKRRKESVILFQLEINEPFSDDLLNEMNSRFIDLKKRLDNFVKLILFY